MVEVYLNSSSMIPIDRYYEYDIYDLVIEAYKNFEGEYDVNSIDLIVVANAYSQKLNNASLIAPKIAEKIGKPNVPSIKVDNADASGGAALLTAYSLIKSNMVNSVLIVGVEKQSDYPSKYLYDAISTNLDDYMFYNGISSHSVAALLMRQYMKRYGVDRNYFANWAIKMHKNATENPFAYLRFQVDLNTVINSQIISDPVRLFDVGARADGAAILLLSNNKTESAVKINKILSAQARYDFSPSLPSVRMLRDKLELKFSERTGIDIHDSYSIMAALMLEEAGIFESGKSLHNLDSVNVNLGGGLKARGHVGGASAIYQLAEAHMQLIGSFKGKKASVDNYIVISSDDLGMVSYGINLSR
ncbi:thiolase family protein [Saccharolobus solfataricus]|uniref:Acetyl-CoA c-acetyltransferase (Acetoacetyl-CoA thiolase) (AcaB-1) n=3 Tax=Saccharolobus solfataricus TaxID=2287 RepID=Q7LXW2_SACS2|nr:thiolase family protein [Saccharolobus solfataricus]AAK40853.1 Acetyl-CoA c-acetyltransferase (acetoacetyl-CoA thiolase) (acaB-1) [Saccharolobus solfataricus P2]AKA73889.1 thiolase family protein [Saccharolobus solfataricus]AKA76587.1 thiolase family protein [Saccharolobus solfataricus]AKA79280.1 thiolase family protein [Saccharolobus solfataricus]AZF68366.1 thiolase family protein [Saccharolobus solfataricus]